MGLFSSQISIKKMVPLCRQFATAHQAGIPVIQSLAMAADNTNDRTLKEVLIRMGDAVRSGSTLEQAGRAESKYLPLFFIELLASGEYGGKLDVMLRDLANYYEDRLAMQRQLVRAMAYPTFQLMVLWYFGSFALGIVGRIYASGFSLAGYFRDYAVFQVKALVVAAILVAVCALLWRKGIFQYIWGRFTTSMWPISKVTQKFALARFFRTLSLLIGSGMNITLCIERAAAVVTNPYIERDLLQAIPLVKEGATLVQAFSGSRYLSRMAREMLAIGEQSGELEQALLKVSEYHLEEASHAVQIAARAGGVLVAILVACLIGYVIISFYMKLYGGMFDALGI